MIKLSVSIITLNEEKNIERCLKSVQSIADEVLVLDSFSTDRTRNICEEYGALFIQHEFHGHIQQKNYALSLLSHDYVLCLDADEALDQQAIKEILEIKKDWKGDGYSFPRLTYYVDQWVRHSGWYPDRKLRLVKKQSANWSGVNPHDILCLRQGNELKLHGHILHYSYNTISEHIEQTNKFTTIAAQEAFERGIRSSYFKIVTRPTLKFFKDFFLKGGILDGKYGPVICFINALSSLLKYSKLKDLQEGRPIK